LQVWLFALAWLNQATPGQDHPIMGKNEAKYCKIRLHTISTPLQLLLF
jgi:hypothetical protein